MEDIWSVTKAFFKNHDWLQSIQYFDITTSNYQLLLGYRFSYLLEKSTQSFHVKSVLSKNINEHNLTFDY